MLFIRQPINLRITHVDAGVDNPQITDSNTGKWAKVSFNDGETFSWFRLSNTKILFSGKKFKYAFTDPEYERLVLEFIKSPRPYAESNWKAQRKRQPSTYAYVPAVEPEKELA